MRFFSAVSLEKKRVFSILQSFQDKRPERVKLVMTRISCEVKSDRIKNSKKRLDNEREND